MQDTGPPFRGTLCGCHSRGGDGIIDLSLRFDNAEVVNALQLNAVAPGASVVLIVKETLSDGCEFIAGDFMVRTVINER